MVKFYTAGCNVICREISVLNQKKRKGTVEENLSARMTAALVTNVTMVGDGSKGWQLWSILIFLISSCDLDGKK